MLGVYLSGTGNTRHCITKLLSLLDPDASLIPIESRDAAERIRNEDTIFLAYPTQFSNIPFMIRDFINTNSSIWEGKKVFCLTTMGAFSGDGTGVISEALKHKSVFGAVYGAITVNRNIIARTYGPLILIM